MSETPENEPCDCRPTGNQDGPRLSVYCERHDGPLNVTISDSAESVSGPNLNDAPIVIATPDQCEQAREEGRREVLREIAALKPDSDCGDGGGCNFCESFDGHKSDCLWLRAQEAVKP